MEIIKSSGYDIFIGSDAFNAIQKFASGKRYKDSRVFILTDENTLTHCLPGLITNVSRFADAEILETESGEENKNIEVCTQLWHALSDCNANRKTLFVNLGGGVICDMGGFTASAYKRGIDFINIPTTLLAQVDASIGGKTGVDLGILKNQVGFFRNPAGVYIIPEFLNTLDKRQLNSGFAEVIKHALIADKSYWKKLKDFSLDDDNWEDIITKSVSIKNDIVLRDPLESGLRKVLNLGHTIGHALESFFMKRNVPVLHGEAVAAGMICESWISFKRKMITQKELDEIVEYISERYEKLDVQETQWERLLELMRNDKKNKKDEISFTLLEGIGNTVIDQYCSEKEITGALTYYSKL